MEGGERRMNKLQKEETSTTTTTTTTAIAIAAATETGTGAGTGTGIGLLYRTSEGAEIGGRLLSVDNMDRKSDWWGNEHPLFWEYSDSDDAVRFSLQQTQQENNNKEEDERAKESQTTKQQPKFSRWLPVKEGYLMKKGHKRRNWKVRYFILNTNSSLMYYSSSSSPSSNTLKKLKGEIKLTRESEVDEERSMGKANCFSISTSLPDNPNYVIYIAAPTHDEMSSWISSLSLLISSSPN